MWVRKRIDIGWSDLVYGIGRCFLPIERTETARKVEAVFSPEGHAFACLSVRTGFDLLLKALDLPQGSEVLLSAVTIHDMARIVEHHGLVPVPVDLDMSRLAPKIDSLKKAITPKTRAIVVAHLFGTRVPLESILEVSQEHDLLVIEDCAQAFGGGDYRGHAQADVSMFSFGPIKTSSALAGAVIRIRDDEVREKMRELHEQYPQQPRWAYFFRLLKYVAVKVMSSRWFLGSVARLCRLFGGNHDGIASGLARGFAGRDFFGRIRRRPPAPLFAVLERRLRLFDEELIRRRTYNGRLLLERLNGSVLCPGAEADEHSFWVFPIVVDEPVPLLDKLWRAGFDATQESSMRVIAPPPGREELTAHEAESLLEHITYLPFYPGIPVRSLERMADVILQECRETPSVAANESPSAAEEFAKETERTVA